MPNLRAEQNGQAERYYTNLYERAVNSLDVGPASIIPRPNTLLVRLVDPDKMTSGGLHLPEMALREKGLGVVLRVNPLQAKECFYAEGDLVLFRTHAGQVIELEAEGQFVLLQWTGGIDDEILAKIDSKPALDAPPGTS